MFNKYFFLFLKGLAMGAVNKIPGVSGGTVAFVTGIYEDLINSIKKINYYSLKILFTKGFNDFYKEINGDPMFQITVAYNKIDDFKLLSELLSANPSKKKKNEIKKDFLFKNQKLFQDSFAKTSANTKLVIFDDNRWLIYVYGTQNIVVLKLNIKSFVVTVNDHIVLLTSWCLSAKTCKTIKKQMASIIEPSFPITVNDLKKVN